MATFFWLFLSILKNLSIVYKSSNSYSNTLPQMKCCHFCSHWRSDAKCKDKKIDQSRLEKVSVPMETWKCDSNPKNHAFWIYQSASSRQLLVQASLEDYKLGATEKTEFEYWVGRLATKMDFRPVGTWKQKKTQKTITVDSQQRLLIRVRTSVFCISVVSSVFHGSNTYSCFLFVLKVELLHIFWEQTYQWSFWLPWNHSKLQKKECIRSDDP